jgi:hypothetical protein
MHPQGGEKMDRRLFAGHNFLLGPLQGVILITEREE